MVINYRLLVPADDEIGVYVVVGQELLPRASVALLNVVSVAKILQSRLGDVHTTGDQGNANLNSNSNIMFPKYPGIPPDSSLFAMVTSFDQTSNCHFLNPKTPQSTEPEWTPIRMANST